MSEVADEGAGVLLVQSPQHLQGGCRDWALTVEHGQPQVPVAGLRGEGVDAGGQRDRQARVRVILQLDGECVQVGAAEQAEQLRPVVAPGVDQRAAHCEGQRQVPAFPRDLVCLLRELPGLGGGPAGQQSHGRLRVELAQRDDGGAGNGGGVAGGDQHPARRPGHGERGHVRLVPHVVQHEQAPALGEQAAQPRPPLRHVGDRPAVPQGGGQASLQLQQRRVRAQLQPEPPVRERLPHLRITGRGRGQHGFAAAAHAGQPHQLPIRRGRDQRVRSPGSAGLAAAPRRKPAGVCP